MKNKIKMSYEDKKELEELKKVPQDLSKMNKGFAKILQGMLVFIRTSKDVKKSTNRLVEFDKQHWPKMEKSLEKLAATFKK